MNMQPPTKDLDFIVVRFFGKAGDSLLEFGQLHAGAIPFSYSPRPPVQYW